MGRTNLPTATDALTSPTRTCHSAIAHVAVYGNQGFKKTEEGIGNGEWRLIKNGKFRMDKGQKKMRNGDWRLENEEWVMHE